MSWLLSIGVAVLTGLVGTLVSGFVATLAVGWYRVSSFEGGSGYFVIGIALAGLLGGAIIGLVTSRVLSGTHPTFVRVVGISCGMVLLLAVVAGGVSRLLADVPPTIGGEDLMVAFELRWPATETRAPSDFPGVGTARLGAGSGRRIRARGDGVLFLRDAHQVDGRWVVPGAVSLFTSRGTRILDVMIGDTTLAGFLMPLPGQPGEQEQDWSEWLPRPRPGDLPLPDQYSYRFRVVRASEPVRHETVGPFEIATSVSSLHSVAATSERAAVSQFRVSFNGAPVSGLGQVAAAAVVVAERPALLVREGETNGSGRCLLLTADDGRATLTPTGECTGALRGELLTADSAAWHSSRSSPAALGWLDRSTFAVAGLYRLDGGILDTRTLTFSVAKAPSEPLPINGLPPITLSPDERSYVWFTHNGSDETPVLCVTNWREQSTYVVPIERRRMRYNAYDRLDLTWVAHHFAWLRGADGADTLVERSDFTPLPYRGDREIDWQGQMTSYYLRPGGKALRDAMVDAMVNALGAERLPDELDGYQQVVRYEGKLIKSAVVGSGGFVSIGMDVGSIDSAVMMQLADQLDRLVATGRYDAVFRLDTESDVR